MLTQAEADGLLGARKWFPPGTTISLPSGKQVYDLESELPAEHFVLDTYRGTIRLSKVTYQNRVRSAEILARLDLNGSPHTNPDGKRIDCPHLHLYREGYEDKWAFPLDGDKFGNPGDIGSALVDFCALCAIDMGNVLGLEDRFL